MSLDGQHRKETVRTDAEGQFRFEGLRKGQYTLQGRSAGHSGRMTAKVESTPVTDVVLALGPSSAITGLVRDEEGAPIAEARVWGSRRSTSMYEEASSADVFTAADGRYRLDLSGGGTFQLTVSKKGFLGTPSIDVELRQGEVTQAPELVLRRGTRLTGIVVDEAGAPVRDASIRTFVNEEAFEQERGGDAEAALSSFIDSGGTDEEGHFELLELHAGVLYDASVSAEGFLSRRIAVRGGAPQVRWVLERGASITGVVLDPSGAPLRGVNVRAEKQVEDAPDAVPDEADAVTGSDGRFHLSGLSGGKYAVEASRTNAADPAVGRPAAMGRVVLPARGSVEVQLQFTGGHTLTGRAVGEEGAPLRDARMWIAVRQEEGMAAKDPLDEGMTASAATNAAGEFTFMDVPSGSYSVSGWARDHVTPEPVIVDVPSDLPVEIAFGKSGRLVGRVLGADGRPLTQFSVNLAGKRHPEGRFEVPVRRDGKVELTLGAPGHAFVTRELEGSKSRVIDVGDVRLEHGRTLRGTVKDAAGAPVEGVLVDVGPLSQLASTGLHLAERFGAVRTDQSGRFELPNVGAEPQMLVAQHDAHPEYRQELAPHVGEVDIRFPAGARIVGRVAGSAGAPGVGAQVHALTTAGAKSAEVTKEGTFELPALAPGKVTVAVSSDESGFPAYQPRTVTVAQGETVTLDFSPEPGSCDLILLIDAPSNPSGGIATAGALLPAGTPPVSNLKELFERRVGTEAAVKDGRLAFHAVPPGDYVVEVFQFANEKARVSRQEVRVGTPCPPPIAFVFGNSAAIALDVR